MSGYKNTGMSQETYQAMLAHGAYHGLSQSDGSSYDAWDALNDDEREKWLAAAAEVCDDTRTEPRF